MVCGLAAIVSNGLAKTARLAIWWAHARIAAALAEDHGRVIGRPGQVAREGQSRLMARAFLVAAGFHAADRLPHHVVGPGALAAGRLVGAVENELDAVLRGLQQQRFVQVDKLLGFMIEEVDLGAGDAEVVQHLEELLARLGGA